MDTFNMLHYYKDHQQIKMHFGIYVLPFDIISYEFSVPQIEYPLGGSSKKCSHVYFLLQVFWVILLFEINVVLMLPW